MGSHVPHVPSGELPNLSPMSCSLECFLQACRACSFLRHRRAHCCNTPERECNVSFVWCDNLVEWHGWSSAFGHETDTKILSTARCCVEENVSFDVKDTSWWRFPFFPCSWRLHYWLDRVLPTCAMSSNSTWDLSFWVSFDAFHAFATNADEKLFTAVCAWEVGP